jgi:hypothetical protein
VQCSAVQFGEAFPDFAVENPPFVPNSAAHKAAKTTALQLLSLNCAALHCIALHCIALKCFAVQCSAV